MTDELARLDATAQAALVAAGKISAMELVDAAIARLSRHNPQLNAVIRDDAPRARARAAGPLAGPFAGVPALLKDTGAAEAGQPLCQGMRALKDAPLREAQDSHLFRRLMRAGFVSLGRTNMPELAIVATSEPEAYGPTRNPWDLQRTAGGSSGGSAAAVAAGIVPVAHASDGGGSIRGPASMCGLVGLKPSRGRSSMGPQRGERWSSLSVEHVLTRSVRDSAALLDVLAGPEPGDPYHAPPPARSFCSVLGEQVAPLRIGLLAHAPRGIELDAQTAETVQRAGRLLQALGHRVELAYPAALDEPEPPLLWVQLVAANVARGLDAQGERLGRTLGQDDVEPLTFAMAEAGHGLSAPNLLRALEQMHALGRRLCAFFLDHDLLLTPTQALPPPPIGYLTSTREEPWRALLRCTPYGVFTLPWNMSGQPAISLPLGMTTDGLPIGCQLVAARGREDLLLAVAAQLEREAPWAERTPPCFG